MTTVLRSRPLALAFALVVAVGTLVTSTSAQAQQPIGAEATKDCPGETATIGTTVTCTFIVENTGAFPAEVTALTEQSPFPGGDIVDISCTAGGAVINEGDTLAPNIPCTGTFQVTIPNNPALCGTTVLDRVNIALLYTTLPEPLVAGAFATNITLIVCPPPTSTTTTTTPTTTTTTTPTTTSTTTSTTTPTTTSTTTPTTTSTTTTVPGSTTTTTSTTVPGSTTTAASTTTVPGPTTTAAPTTTIRRGLPKTGTSWGVTVAAAVCITAFGAAALLLTRRRAS